MRSVTQEHATSLHFHVALCANTAAENEAAPTPLPVCELLPVFALRPVEYWHARPIESTAGALSTRVPTFGGYYLSKPEAAMNVSGISSFRCLDSPCGLQADFCMFITARVIWSLYVYVSGPLYGRSLQMRVLHPKFAPSGPTSPFMTTQRHGKILIDLAPNTAEGVYPLYLQRQ